MNKQIQALAQQAGIHYYKTSQRQQETEQLVEVIVRECCLMINAHVQHNNPHDCLLVLAIKERFGIE